MAQHRFSIRKSFLGVNSASKMFSTWSSNSSLEIQHNTFQLYSRSSSCTIFNYHNTKGCYCSSGNMGFTQIRMLSHATLIDAQHLRSDSHLSSAPGYLWNKRLTKGTLFPLCISGYRAYSADSKDITNAATSGETAANSNDLIGSDWIANLKLAWQSVKDATAYAQNKASEASNEFTPYVQQIVESNPYLKDVVVPFAGTTFAALLTWLVMPRILRRLHKYSMQGPIALLSGRLPEEQISYEKGFWGALEDPIRYLITFMAFSQLAVMIAPTTVASQYIVQAWRAAVILSFVWFLHRWKTNVFTRALAPQNIAGLDRERLLALDKLSSVGLFVLGLMASAEACGVAVQSIITVGGIGGVATAFAARDILGNVLSGFSMQFSRPFSVGDTIKAGSIEGQVVEMGLTTTSLLNSEKFPTVVPNSLFSSQVIVNKSRAQWHGIVTKIPLRIEDLEKIPQVSEDINCMLRSHPYVFLGREAPYCFLSQIEHSYAELTIGCNLKHMRKDELLSKKQDIIVKSAQIIKRHGAELGSMNSGYQNY